MRKERMLSNFPKLDANRNITAQSFKDAGYYGVEWVNVDVRVFVNAITWCDDNMKDRYDFVDRYFWFTTIEDATHFRLVFT